ncbi:O-antigen ligase family protein [Vibrio sp. 10N.261.51.C6]|uniref:O-antigen ligase family protein n=1 Tax=Vibrio sp. 10N.261.51.C6 TaxID=3229676 RepID=UPI003552632E
MQISMRFFPAALGLTALLAASQLGLITKIGEIGRWVLMLVGAWGALAWRTNNNDYFLKNLYAWFFVVVCFLSSIWSWMPAYSIFRSISVVLLFVCCFGGVRCWIDIYGNEEFFSQIEKLIGSYVLGNLVIGLVGFPNSWFGGLFRGVFANPNQLAIVCGFCSAIFCRQLFKQFTFIRALFFLSAFISVLLSGGRTGTILFLFSSALVFIFQESRYKKLYNSLGAVCALVGIPFLLNKIQAYFLKSGTENLLSNRAWAWEVVEEKISNSPWLGHGFGTDGYIWDLYNIELGYRMHGTGSSYYGLLFQFGWVLTTLFILVLLVFSVRTLINGVIYKDDRVVYGAILISGLLAAYTEPWLTSAGNAYAWLYWSMFAMAMNRMETK